MNRSTMKFFAVIVIALAGSAVQAENLYTQGHGDLGIGYDAGAFDLHVHLEGGLVNGVLQNDVEFEADDLIIVVPLTTLEPRPADAAYAPIGVGAGVNYWKLPQTEAEADAEFAPFLGLGTEELDPGNWVTPLTIEVTSVTAPAGSEYYSIFQEGLSPTFQASTFDPSATVNGNNTFSFGAGGHDHFNHAFTAPGDWLVTMEATAEHVTDGIVSGSGTYTFRVVPEPATAGLFGLGLFMLMRRR